LLVVATLQNCFSYFQVMENGIVYLVSMEGQKTGFYADQRESRDFISTLSRDQKVLDLCCYSGGFALSAAKGGATKVIGITLQASEPFSSMFRRFITVGL
jgi:23S rRNA G2069 N7-methylase RlmK/C1962 C5-methylase RlmI